MMKLQCLLKSSTISMMVSDEEIVTQYDEKDMSIVQVREYKM